MSDDLRPFRKALDNLKSLLDMHPLLGVSGPMHNGYYDLIRTRIERLVILAERTPTTSAKDFDGLKLLVDLRVLVKALKREDVTPESLDAIIRPRLGKLKAHISSIQIWKLEVDEIEEIRHLTEIIQTLNREGFEELEEPLKKLNELHKRWVNMAAAISEEGLRVGVPLAYDPHRGLLISDSALEEAGTDGGAKLLVGVDGEDRGDHSKSLEVHSGEGEQEEQRCDGRHLELYKERKGEEEEGAKGWKRLSTLVSATMG